MGTCDTLGGLVELPERPKNFSQSIFTHLRTQLLPVLAGDFFIISSATTVIADNVSMPVGIICDSGSKNPRDPSPTPLSCGLNSTR